MRRADPLPTLAGITMAGPAPQSSRSAGSSSRALQSMKSCWCSAPTWTSATWVNPACTYSRTALTYWPVPGPHGTSAAMSS